MKPFCGYNMADYFGHWLDMGDRLGSAAPRIFRVNWFRKSTEGKWLWPGYSENSRVLKWMCQRVEGRVSAEATPIGLMPTAADLDLTGLDISAESLRELLRADVEAMRGELPDLRQHFRQFGDRLPVRLRDQLMALEARLAGS
jgi:phosphoenolpyruvate carboxykinase (GTP)